MLSIKEAKTGLIPIGYVRKDKFVSLVCFSFGVNVILSKLTFFSCFCMDFYQHFVVG